MEDIQEKRTKKRKNHKIAGIIWIVLGIWMTILPIILIMSSFIIQGGMPEEEMFLIFMRRRYFLDLFSALIFLFSGILVYKGKKNKILIISMTFQILSPFISLALYPNPHYTYSFPNLTYLTLLLIAIISIIPKFHKIKSKAEKLWFVPGVLAIFNTINIIRVSDYSINSIRISPIFYVALGILTIISLFQTAKWLLFSDKKLTEEITEEIDVDNKENISV